MTTAHMARRATALARWALAWVLACSSLAMAQGEATLDQVYQAAQAGRVEQALQMMQPVLKAHPDSGKAHYVQAELLARQGQTAEARVELRHAEQLAPGLPFAKSDAVQHLQRELGLAPVKTAARQAVVPSDKAAGLSGGFGVPWGVLLAVAGGALAAWVLMRLGRPAVNPVPASPPASFGPVSGVEQAVPANGPFNPAGPAATGGLGSRVAGGLPTGLAVGAGVMAAEAIGRNLFGGAAQAATPPAARTVQDFDPVFGDATANRDLGGNDFGIGDAGSWDNAAPDSSDWDV